MLAILRPTRDWVSRSADHDRSCSRLAAAHRLAGHACNADLGRLQEQVAVWTLWVARTLPLAIVLVLEEAKSTAEIRMARFSATSPSLQVELQILQLTGLVLDQHIYWSLSRQQLLSPHSSGDIDRNGLVREVPAGDIFYLRKKSTLLSLPAPTARIH